MRLDLFHESRLMKSNFHKKQFYKDSFIFMMLHKNTENYCLFCIFMEYESTNTIFYRIGFHDEKSSRICFYESSLNMSIDS